MKDAKYLGKVGTNAVRELRVSKLRHGYPFMINSKDLPVGQCYLEYPSGSIVLATLSKTNQDFDIVRELGAIEIVGLRKKFGLDQVFE